MPADARIVAQAIRESVPKPAGPWSRDEGVWVVDGPKGQCCPIGLMPDTLSPAPTVPYGIKADHLTSGDRSLLWQSFDAFISWWDGLESAEAASAAADEVWPCP